MTFLRSKISALICFFVMSFSCNATPVHILIVYFSQNGHTEQLAKAVANGAKQVPDVEVKLIPVQEASVEDAVESDAIILGTGTYNANVAPALQEYINRWPMKHTMKDKIGAAFVTGGGFSAGQESTQLSLLRSMLIFGMITVGGENWTSPFGAAAITAESPFDGPQVDVRFLVKGEKLGQRVAKLAVRMKTGFSYN